MTAGPVRVTTRIGDFTVTVEVAPTSAAAPPTTPPGDGPEPDPGPKLTLAGGRQLPKLLFATNTTVLGKQIGIGEAEIVTRLIADAGHKLVGVETGDPNEAAKAVQAAIDDTTAGVVLVGGYEVLPSFVIDTLPAESAAEGVSRAVDLDSFLVWNDDRYVDTDGDGLPELPVSRVPTAHSSITCLRQLTSEPVPVVDGRGGMRNHKRPFAATLVGANPGDAPLATSIPDDALSQPSWITKPLTYVMLHGLDTDGTRLWGEDDHRSLVAAVGLADLPDEVDGTFFSGCCWGALISSATARTAKAGKPVADRTPQQSIALALLDRGADAFIGCTGSHYSPKGDNVTKYGAVYHKAFFDFVAAGAAPAQAAFSAKQAYLAYMAGIHEATELAYATKTLYEFTCLGLGW